MVCLMKVWKTLQELKVQSVCTQTLYKLDRHRVRSSQLKCVEGRLIQRPNHLDSEMTSSKLSFVLDPRTKCARCTSIPVRENHRLLIISAVTSRQKSDSRSVKISVRESKEGTIRHRLDKLEVPRHGKLNALLRDAELTFAWTAISAAVIHS